MACNLTSSHLKELASFTGMPIRNLTTLSRDCSEICALAYGKENPDVAGIGMMVYYTVQIFLSILYGPILFSNLFFFLRTDGPPSAPPGPPFHGFATWLLSSQELFFFSQLWFTLATSLACFVRQLQQATLGYEGAAVAVVISLSVYSLLMTVSAYYQPFRQTLLVLIAIFGIVPFSIFAIYRHQEQIDKFGGLMQLCADIYGPGVPSPHQHKHSSPGLPVGVALTSFFAIAWLSLWWRRGSKPKAAGFLSREYSPAEWALGIVVFLGSTVSAALSLVFLITLWRMRRAISVISGDASEENAWGIGQIAATFAWGPLMVDMVYKARKIWSMQIDLDGNSTALSRHAEQHGQTDVAILKLRPMLPKRWTWNKSRLAGRKLERTISPC